MFFCFLFLFLSTALAQFGCHGKENTNPIHTAPPTYVKEVKNGKLYTGGPITPHYSVVHMWGTPYEMGYAHGQLIKDKIDDLYSEVWAYLESQVESAIPYLPEFLKQIIAELGIEGGLEATYLLTRDYTPQYFFDEIRGIAEGSGRDYMDMVRVHMFPELIKAACSMVGAWGPATANVKNGELLQLRALDWDTKGPFQKYPALLVYHPSANNTNDFAILSFAGFIGTLTGVSSAHLGVCEKVWLSYNGTSSRSGIPWHFLLRDILQWDPTVDSAINRIVTAPRTCSIHVGVGDIEHKFRAIEYSYETATVYDDGNYPVYLNHPRRKGLVFINKHVQPNTEPCLGDLLGAAYGNIDAKALIQIAAKHETGDAHAAIYDFGNDNLYITSAGPYVPGSGAQPAYTRPWSEFSMSALWNEKPPIN